MAFSASIACEAGKALVDISLAFLVAAALVIVNIRVCLILSRSLAAADEPKPEEAAAKEGQRGRLANRDLGECEGVYLVICHGVTAHVVRVIVGTVVAPNVALCARNREQDARRIKNRNRPRIHDIVVDERAEWGDGRPPRIEGGAEQTIDWIAIDGAGERGDVETTTVCCPGSERARAVINPRKRPVIDEVGGSWAGCRQQAQGRPSEHGRAKKLLCYWDGLALPAPGCVSQELGRGANDHSGLPSHFYVCSRR